MMEELEVDTAIGSSMDKASSTAIRLLINHLHRLQLVMPNYVLKLY